MHLKSELNSPTHFHAHTQAMPALRTAGHPLLSKVTCGVEIPCGYQRTLHASFNDVFRALFFETQPIATSKVFARQLGLKDTPHPLHHLLHVIGGMSFDTLTDVVPLQTSFEVQ